MFKREADNVEEEGGVLLHDSFRSRVVWVGGGVVGHKEVEEDENEVLQRKGDPVDVAPADEAGDNAGEEASQEHSE